MKKIYNNLTIENLTKTEWFNQFNEDQQIEILKGLENNLDVSIYAKPEFDDFQMNAIRTGLEDNLDVSVYAKPEFDEFQMNQIRWGLKNNLDVSIYANPRFDWVQMKAFREKLENDKKYVINNRLINKNEISGTNQKRIRKQRRCFDLC